jgi:hypothetical protein
MIECSCMRHVQFKNRREQVEAGLAKKPIAKKGPFLPTASPKRGEQGNFHKFPEVPSVPESKTPPEVRVCDVYTHMYMRDRGEREKERKKERKNDAMKF